MTIRALGGKIPRIAASAWVSEAAYIVGDVQIGDESSVWPGAVVRGDLLSIRIGRRTHVEDNCVLHGTGTMEIGDEVLIGHSVVLHCRQIGNLSLVGNHATVLDDVIVGNECVIAAGALVLPRTVIPDRSFAVGVPAAVHPVRQSHLEYLHAMHPAEGGYESLLREYKAAGL
jgi:carbonic anhydrase/acetyltransferase-like protein (isoleucine patch superfamily)